MVRHLPALVLWVPLAGVAADRPLSTLHSGATIVDLHADTPLQLVLRGGYSLQERLEFGEIDLPRLREGNVGAQFFVLYPDAKAVRAGKAEDFCRRALSAIRRAVAESGGIAFVATVEEYREARARGLVAAILGMEGADCLSGVESLQGWRSQGVRYLGLTWNTSNRFATAAADRRRRRRGLTRAGRRLVREANRLGVLVDVSHASERTFWDVYREARAPIIASHSNAKSLRRHLRNLDDEQARAIARTGGVIGVNFHQPFLTRRRRATVDDVARHAAHLVRVAGADHVGLGSDFDGNIRTPVGLRDVSELPNLTAALRRRGLSDEQIRKVLGLNVLRVLGNASRDVHRGPRLVPLRARGVWPRSARRLFDRNDLTRHRLRGRVRFRFAGRPTHVAAVPCSRGTVRVVLRRGRRVVARQTLTLGEERVEAALPDLPRGPYRAEISGPACLREATVYGP